MPKPQHSTLDRIRANVKTHEELLGVYDTRVVLDSLLLKVRRKVVNTPPSPGLCPTPSEYKREVFVRIAMDELQHFISVEFYGLWNKVAGFKFIAVDKNGNVPPNIGTQVVDFLAFAVEGSELSDKVWEQENAGDNSG